MNKEDKTLLIKAVHDIVESIPYGRATSYGAIAKASGYPNSSRLIGRIMTDGHHLAAHRVVNSQGLLSGRKAFGNNSEMQKLLEAEGIVVVNNKIKNWKEVFWDPINEIKI